jgi:TRAP-type mannitol/chloroaromatic compound transport system permease small subunit
MRPLLRLAGGIDRLNDAVYAATRWLTLLMIFVGAYNAIARYATRFTGVALSSNAYFDLQWYMFSLIFLLGAAYGLNRDAHVRVDVVYARLEPRARAWIDLLGTALFLVPFCIMMLVTSWPAVRNSWAVREGSPDPGGLARYPIKTVILICFALLLLQAFSLLIKRGAALAGKLPLDVTEAEPRDATAMPPGQPEGV